MEQNQTGTTLVQQSPGRRLQKFMRLVRSATAFEGTKEPGGRGELEQSHLSARISLNGLSVL